ncbi:MAG: glycosyltransferase [Paludibacteraceae bacterium]|nr:glycosyltransferase [Paludibacteraceae bacterium]
MVNIHLPISKSIANRILLLQAIHGDPLMRVSSDMPDDVIVLHNALTKLREHFGTPQEYSSLSLGEGRGEVVLNLKNCGTALRFLQVHLALCYPNAPITLTGDPRLMERDGKPTSQTTSALIMHGIDIPYDPAESPYITMSRKLTDAYKTNPLSLGEGRGEVCWSAAAFWYEYIAIHGGELLLEGLTSDSIQGDRIVADIYAKHFGVTTTFTPEGAKITNYQSQITNGKSIKLDFTDFPDLYPAIALTCERLGILLHATGTERLRYKESDRLEAVRLHEIRSDHRMAMALMCADYIKPLPTSPEGKEIQKIIAKSYPQFVEQLNSLLLGRDGVGFSIAHITPRKGINDDNLGKKHALSKLIHAASAEYLWLHDDDVVLPKAATKEPNLTFPKGKENVDLIILPLRMESPLLSGRDGVGSFLLTRLQIAEYAAIQELTIRTAKRGHAVMCSGANLIVRREAWLACEPDLHPEIPSGDDMFLLEAAKRRGLTISVIDEPDYTAVVRPIPTWRAFLRQRMRWAGKAPHYTDRDIRRCGALILTANILQLLCPPVLLIKFPIEYALIRQRQKREQQSSNLKSQNSNFLTILLLEILYPFYMLICLLGGLFRRKLW